MKTGRKVVIAIIVIMGFILTTVTMGAFIGGIFIADFTMKYPMVDCVWNMDISLNPGDNGMFVTEESIRDTIQWHCAKEYVDFNATYDSLIEIE